MAGEWYYTTNKQQMGPVSWEELKQLADTSLLKPSDLVWSDGMPEWVKAVKQDGLFAAAAPPAETPRPVHAEAPPPRRPARRDDDVDDAPPRRKAAEGSGVGMKIGLILGGVFLLLVLLGCGVGGLILGIWYFSESPPPPPQIYNINLGPNGGQDERTFRVRSGQRIRVVVNATNMVGFQRPNFDTQVLRNNGMQVNAVMFRPDCICDTMAPATDNYRVRIVNRSNFFGAATVNVTITNH